MKVGRVRAALQLLWNGVPVETVSLGATPDASTSSSGQLVSVDSTLQLSTVWACVRLISETIATLPLNLYQKTPRGRVPAVGHRLYPVLHSRPNSKTTAAQHWEATVASMLLRDGAYSEILRYDGQVVGLKFLVRDRLTKDVRAQVYRYLDPDTNRFREIAVRDVFKIPGFTLDGENGLSAIQYGANVFGASQAAEEAAGAKFKNGLAPTVALEYPQLLKADQREEARASLQKISGAANSGKGVVLESGVKAHVVGISPVDAQLLESRQFGVEELCRWFRVPPVMVGHANVTAWGTGVEQITLGFLTFTLSTWLTRIEQAINTQLLLPEEEGRYYAEFVVEGLLRGDSKARAEFYQSMLQNGVYNRDEVRAKENLPPIPQGGQVHTVQSNLISLADIGKRSASP
jgi:HK97 family phage portal protein